MTQSSRRFICGDRFHTKTNPHKSKLSYPESLNNKKNDKRNRSACTQNLARHIYYNYLMDYYDNLEIVQEQKAALSIYEKEVTRDELLRFVFN